MKQISVIILCFNEELHLARCIESLRAIAKNIFVVDAYSTDRSEEIATGLGARVLKNKFVNQAQQFQWALENCRVDTEWVMRLDADEYLEPALSAEIVERLPTLPAEVTGVRFPRKHVFLGRWIKHGDRYPLLLLRLWRTGAARMEQRWMDEHIVLEHGSAETFKHDFVDHNLRDLSAFVRKHNDYATREALEVLNWRFGLFAPDRAQLGQGLTQASAKRFVKDNIYNKLPFFVGPLAYFMYRYVLRLGFLDGKEGLAYHFLQGFWYRFLIQVKVLELQRALAGYDTTESRLARLKELTGYDLTQ